MRKKRNKEIESRDGVAKGRDEHIPIMDVEVDIAE